MVTYGQLVACATVLAAGCVTRDARPIEVGGGGKPRPCVSDESHPKYRKRTLAIGQREFKLRLGLCVPDVEAVAILKAYRDDLVRLARFARGHAPHAVREREK